MDYKVCILAAGAGSRMGDFTKVFNKALLPLGGKPAICHIIEKFPDNIDIVIAVGYKKETVIEYLKHNYPNRKLKFVVVDNWNDMGSGPGYSLLCCKEYLQSPFIQFAADTLILGDVPEPTENWIGLAPVSNTKRFCSVALSGNKVIRLEDNTDNHNKYAYIGLFGVNDVVFFWNNLESSTNNFIENELQVSNGLAALIRNDLYAVNFSWFDVGTLTSYSHALRNFPDGEPFTG